MMNRKKIVFMIDTKPLTSGNYEICIDDVLRQIRFCTLRILTYFGGKHKLSGRKGSSGPLWGYKFYKSSGGHLDYGNHHFYDLKLKDFENFEEELEERFLKAKGEGKLRRSSSSVSIADQFSCTLAEVVAGFQWERPDFFSPIKSNRKLINNKKPIPQIFEPIVSNFVFLFTPCPACCGDVNYFCNGDPSNPTGLQNSLIKEEVSRKMMNDCKISFNWIDVGKNAGKGNNTFHQMLSKMMCSFSGALVPVENISFWWVEREEKKVGRTSQPGSFGCFMDSLLLKNMETRNNNNCKTKTSIDLYKLSISLNDICTMTEETSSSGICLPLVLRNATIKRLARSNDLQTLPSKEAVTPSKNESNCWQYDDELNSEIESNNIGIVKAVVKSSAALSLVQNCRESYYCSFNYSQLEGHPDGDLTSFKIFQQLLKLLKTKRLILVIELNHPETGHQVNACFQPWTTLAGIVTIMTSSLTCDVATKLMDSQNRSEQLNLVQGLIRNLQTKLEVMKQKEVKNSTNLDLMSDFKTQVDAPTSTSFMQSMDYWFTDLPSHFLPQKLLQNINRMQGVDTENFQRANQRSTALFKKLKDHCRGKRCHGKVKVQKEVVVEQEGGASEYRNLKVRTLSRSAQLIENSKIVKMQRKSEDEIKEKDTELETGKKTENENEELDDDGNVFHDILKDGQGLSTITIEDLLSYMKNEISSVLTQNNTTCEASARRLSRNMVLFLNKLNENKSYEDGCLPHQFLEKVFQEIASCNPDCDKSARVLRHILRVLMDLEIAVLTKQNVIPSTNESKRMVKPINSDNEDVESSSDDGDANIDPVAERVIEQLRPLVFLENPGFIAKQLNTVIFPRFKSKIPHIIREVYEGLGQQVPIEIQSPSQRQNDADDSFEVINDVDSMAFSDYGSNNPSNQSSTGFRRFASVGDSRTLTRQIVMPIRNKKNTNKKKKMGYLPNEITKDAKPNKEGWCRNLFETGPDSNNLAPPTGSKKRKLQRRYSELTASVKDTPAHKQKRHFFWKRQHKERRKADGITDVTIIEESPIKDCSIGESPVKSTGSSRFLSQHQSFTCKTSPRRFYRRNSSFQIKTGGLQSTPPRRRLERSQSCLFNESNHNEERRIWISDTFDLDSANHSTLKTPVKIESCTVLSKETPEKDCENIVITPRKRSFSVGFSPGATLDRTPKKITALDNLRESRNDAPGYRRPKLILDLLEIASTASSFGFDSKLSNKPLLYSEDSMDWVAMFGNEKPIPEHSPLPIIDSVSSYRGSETDSLKGGSPNVLTPLRDGKQPFSSPFLSASSLETLENAPIISPQLRGSKSKRESTCRKRIQITTDDIFDAEDDI